MIDSAKLLDAFMQNAFDLVYVKDMESRVVMCNSAFEKVVGKPSLEIIGKKDSEYLNDKSVCDKLYSNDLEVIRSGTGKIFEESIKTSDGLRVYISNKSPLYDKDGKIIGILGISRDITETKKAQEALAQKEKEYREIIKYAPTGIYEIDFRAKRFTSVNDSMIILTGYSREELLEMDVLTILDEESRNKFLERLAKISKGEKPAENVTYRIIKKDKHAISALLNLQYRYDSDGRLIGAIVVGHDISDRVKVEEERERLLQVLKGTQEKLELALESGKIGIWEWNFQKDEFFIDERTEKIFGLSPGTFGKNFAAFEELINEEDRSHTRATVNKARESGNLLETLYRTNPVTGEIKYICAKGIVVRGEKGEPLRMTGVCIDVTELKKSTENVISRLNEELLRSNMELQNFAYIASHDLQEPLRMVTSFTQLLAMQYQDKLDETAREYIQYSVSGAKRMYNLLNDLLAYSRIQARAPEVSPINLESVLENVLKNLSLAINEKAAIIKIKKPLPKICAEYGHMIVLFQNLISNSLKFSNGIPKIHITSKKIDGEYQISIRDEGIGIEKQYFDRIFQIFQRLNPKKDFQGTGIGLALCKRIVENHGGRIWVKSEPGKGAEFFFTLPANCDPVRK